MNGIHRRIAERAKSDEHEITFEKDETGGERKRTAGDWKKMKGRRRTEGGEEEKGYQPAKRDEQCG